jgi:DNA-binding CsgD family transcriptional regulator
MSVALIAERLAKANDFVEIAIAVCELSREVFGLHQCMVSLQDADGRPTISVDNFPAISDEHRLHFFASGWERDPLFQFAQRHHAPAGEEAVPATEFMVGARAEGYTGASFHPLLLPLLYPRGLLGVIRCASLQPISPALRRDLTTLATTVSVRLTQLGVTPFPSPATSRLTLRQLDVARLAARGMTNAEIAESLSLSENTVKKHLKDIFEELGVGNRTGLAGVIAQAGPAHAYPDGITHAGDLTITVGLARASTAAPVARDETNGKG